MLSEIELGVILSRVEEHPNPKYHLEQYSITPGIAGAILFSAKPDIENKVVYDLGCGSGRFTIGAALLGAKLAHGVDIDQDVLEVAKENARFIESKTGIPLSRNCQWVCADIRQVNVECDTIIQFPPFNLDHMFFERALKMAKNVYSIHRALPETQKKLEEISGKLGVKVMKTRMFRFYLPWKEGGKISHDIILFVAKK